MSKELDPDRLESRIVELQGEIQWLKDAGLETVEYQERVASLQSELWSAKQIIAELMNDHKRAAECTVQALKWEEQKTRAIKYAIADRLTQAERKMEERSKLRADLSSIPEG